MLAWFILLVAVAAILLVSFIVWWSIDQPYPHRADVALHKARRDRQLTDAKAQMTRRTDRNIEAIHDTARRLRREQGR